MNNPTPQQVVEPIEIEERKPMASTTLTIRLDQEDKDFIKAYDDMHRRTVAAVVLESILEHIEDENE